MENERSGVAERADMDVYASPEMTYVEIRTAENWCGTSDITVSPWEDGETVGGDI